MRYGAIWASEFGFIAPQGAANVDRLVVKIEDLSAAVPEAARTASHGLSSCCEVLKLRSRLSTPRSPRAPSEMKHLAG
jgi:hypothetical protein